MNDNTKALARHLRTSIWWIHSSYPISPSSNLNKTNFRLDFLLLSLFPTTLTIIQAPHCLFLYLQSYKMLFSTYIVLLIFTSLQSQILSSLPTKIKHFPHDVQNIQVSFPISHPWDCFSEFSLTFETSNTHSTRLSPWSYFIQAYLSSQSQGVSFLVTFFSVITQC